MFLTLAILCDGYSRYIKPRIFTKSKSRVVMKCDSTQLSFGETETFEKSVPLSQYVPQEKH